MKVCIYENKNYGRWPRGLETLTNAIEIIDAYQKRAVQHWEWVDILTGANVVAVHRADDRDNAVLTAARDLAPNATWIQYSDDFVGLEMQTIDNHEIYQVRHQAIETRFCEFIKTWQRESTPDWGLLSGDPVDALSRAIHLVQNLAMPLRLDCTTLMQNKGNEVDVEQIRQDYLSQNEPFGYLSNGRVFGSGQQGIAEHLRYELERKVNGLSASQAWIITMRTADSPTLSATDLPGVADLEKAITMTCEPGNVKELITLLKEVIRAFTNVENALRQARQKRG